MVPDRDTAADERLREMQALLASILESSLNGIMVLKAVRDEAGKIVDFEWLMVNPAGLRNAGRPQSDFIGRRMSEIYPETWTMGLFERYARVVETGEPLVLEQRFQRKGQPRWARASATKLGDGLVLCYADLTEARLADAALRRSEGFFNAVFEGSPACKQIFSTGGVLLRTNEAFRRLMRLPDLDHGVGVWNLLEDPAMQSLGFAGVFRRAVDGETVELAGQTADLGAIQTQSAAEPRKLCYKAVFFPIRDEAGAVQAVALTLWETAPAAP